MSPDEQLAFTTAQHRGSAQAAAFAALEAIEAGEWDRFLLRLQAAIRMRRETEEYKRHIVAGDET